MGVQFTSEMADRLMEGVYEMEGSSTYDALVNKVLAWGLEKGIEKGEIGHSKKLFCK